MATTTIIVAENSEKNGWWNLKTNDGKEVSVMQEKCPKLHEALKDAKPGTEITVNLVEKNGKLYMWDLDEKKGNGGGGRSFTPKDKNWESAQTAAIAAGNMLFGKAASPEQFDILFNHVFNRITEKITK